MRLNKFICFLCVLLFYQFIFAQQGKDACLSKANELLQKELYSAAKLSTRLKAARFSNEEIDYALSQIDFKDIAAQKAKKAYDVYIKYNYTRKDVVNDLLEEKFTEEEAIWGAEHCNVDFAVTEKAAAEEEKQRKMNSITSSNAPISKKVLTEAFLKEGYTKSEIDSYLTSLEKKNPRIFFEYARDTAVLLAIVEENPFLSKRAGGHYYYDDCVEDLLNLGFTKEEAEYGASHRF